jgi:SAM-dependent methyltransferase
MAEAERWQVSTDAAEVYESCFVPAIFGAWAGPVADAAGIRMGDTVLDVGCGTGVLARDALRRVGQEGQVVGLDLNEGMLAVAARTEPKVEWRQRDAASLPFEDAPWAGLRPAPPAAASQPDLVATYRDAAAFPPWSLVASAKMFRPRDRPRGAEPDVAQTTFSARPRSCCKRFATCGCIRRFAKRRRGRASGFGRGPRRSRVSAAAVTLRAVEAPHDPAATVAKRKL